MNGFELEKRIVMKFQPQSSQRPKYILRLAAVSIRIIGKAIKP
jgi:hypothetical protein